MLEYCWFIFHLEFLFFFKNLNSEIFCFVFVLFLVKQRISFIWTEIICLLSFRKIKQTTKWRKSILLIRLLFLEDSLWISSKTMKVLNERWNVYLTNLLINLYLYPSTYRTMENIKENQTTYYHSKSLIKRQIQTRTCFNCKTNLCKQYFQARTFEINEWVIERYLTELAASVINWKQCLVSLQYMSLFFLV